jgi:predicted DNA-binding protein (MmcQ/YjbR family)
MPVTLPWGNSNEHWQENSQARQAHAERVWWANAQFLSIDEIVEVKHLSQSTDQLRQFGKKKEVPLEVLPKLKHSKYQSSSLVRW